MTFEEAVAYLEARIRYGVRPGLERVRALTELLDHPQRTYPVLHVTGTNGKFSVAAMLTAILGELGLVVGTYTSPHLESVRERIAVGGEPVSEPQFAAAVAYLAPYLELVDRDDPVTYFELLTVMALEIFADRPVHAAVLEVGLGGEYDATNVADAQVAVITRVARDHLREFGDDLRRAAWEKAGVIKPGAVVLCGVEQPELREVVAERARERGAERLAWLGPDVAVTDRLPAVGGQVICLRGLYGTYEELFLPLFGAHQATNAALAVGAAEAFVGRALDRDVVAQALGGVRTPGRIEVVHRRPLVVVDGGHSPDAAQAVLRTVTTEFRYSRLVVVLGMLDDKLVEEVAELLAPAAHRFVCTEPRSERAATAERLAAALAAAGVGGDRIAVEADWEAALSRALGQASDEDLVLVFGSFYLAGDARRWLRGWAAP